MLGFAELAVGQQIYDPKQQLIDKLKRVESLQADFTQRLLDIEGEELQVLQGRMIAQRPNLFRWEVTSPYEMTYQLVDLNLTILDPDLNQVTYEKLSSTQDVPMIAILLHRDAEALKDFEVTQATNFFELKPLKEMQLFTLVTVYFAGTRLDAIDMRDTQNRLTEFSFSNVEENPVLEKSVFDLAIPSDVEVLGVPHSTSN